jgi:hypothetical protein
MIYDHKLGQGGVGPSVQNVPPQRSLSAAAAVVAPPLLAPYPTSTASNENYHTYQHLPLADRATYRTKFYIPCQGSEDTYLHAVLLVSTSQAKGFASPALRCEGS